MRDYTGTDKISLRNLTTALARDAIFGRHELAAASLSGRKQTQVLNKDKLDYIKLLVRSRFQICPKLNLRLFGLSVEVHSQNHARR
jgi:hypothetical protein